MSEFSNTKEGDVLHLILNKTDDQKDIDQDVQMTLDDNNNYSKGRGRGKKGFKGRGRGRGRFKKDKKDKKEWKGRGRGQCKKGKKEWKGIKKQEKLVSKIIKIMEITSEKKKYHEKEVQLLSQKHTDLQNLLNNAHGMDFKDLKKAMVQVLKKSKREKKNGKREEKRFKKDAKYLKKDEKKQKKMERKKFKLERKQAKMLKKQARIAEKKEKIKIMENARIESLPNKIEEKENLELFIDGYNIIGCDSLCRKYIRRKMNLARQRLLELLYEFYQERNLNIGYEIVINAWFDKNGKDFKYNNKINVIFSGKKSVDDTWVEMFGKMKSVKNKIVITSDRELTVRLGKLGVTCMKSGVFYKKYLKKENKNEKDGKVTNNEVIEMIIDGDVVEEDGDGETGLRLAELDENDNESSHSSSTDDDDDEDEDDDEYDIIQMELEGIESQPGAVYPSPK